MRERPSWDAYFMGIAEAAAARSSCPRLAVGAVLVNPSTKSVLSMGYNGAARGTASCEDEGCLMEGRSFAGKTTEHCGRAIHAEQNSIFLASANGQRVKGAVCYVTAQPCWLCARALFQSGVEDVYYSRAYGGELHPLLQDLVSSGDFRLNVCPTATTPVDPAE